MDFGTLAYSYRIRHRFVSRTSRRSLKNQGLAEVSHCTLEAQIGDSVVTGCLGLSASIGRSVISAESVSAKLNPTSDTAVVMPDKSLKMWKLTKTWA